MDVRVCEIYNVDVFVVRIVTALFNSCFFDRESVFLGDFGCDILRFVIINPRHEIELLLHV